MLSIILILDSPAPGNFSRRAHSRAIVLGNFVYIDGGEVSQFVDGGFMPDNQPSHGMNSTLSIDISKSWTASTVEIRAIPRNGPIMLNSEAIWLDTTCNGYYIYGGETSYNQNSTGFQQKEMIWKFTADGQGGGTWFLEEEALSSGPNMIKSRQYTTNSAYASTPNGIGFSIGGHQSRFTDPAIKAGNPRWQTPGMVSYDMRTKEWENHTSIGMLAPNQSLENGRAIHVPGFGPNDDGLVFVLGGAAKAAGEIPPGTAPGPLISFTTVNFFDPVNKTWYSQATTGEAPKGRIGHCVVGAQSPEGSFEIFVYGGASVSYDTAFDDLYVLSLPGFHWFRAEDNRSDSQRASGTCVVVGKRQMLTIGGVDYGKGDIKYWKDQDPLPQGLGIFDMTAMSWVRNGSYNADAETYQAPQVVRNWYRSQNGSTVEWSSGEVEEMFLFTYANVSFATDEPTSNTTNNKTGLIVGCSVAGGGSMVVLALICAAVLLYRRRRRSREKAKLSSSWNGQQNEGFAAQAEKLKPKEWPLQTPATEAYNNRYLPPAELPGGNNHCWELPSPEVGQHTAPSPETKPPRAEPGA
ncbi:hypothetical protein QBC32DRAFT_399921 [Pseudoneurospora amorphoporcata]|uniref:Kelch repeat protein n=1 Tax=Pseudoneurospora amorphoporcata TaxID=241081 RepID=A0AAN6NU51_9PEZI|nr:hypothetical protein QBC32DRAFT_399921 [Pseudoneurospora amorphoporcata]